MGILEDKRKIIWRAIEAWRKKKGLSTHYFSLLTAGKTKEPYPPDRIDRGITDGSERISPDFMRVCLVIFGLVNVKVSARQRSIDPVNSLTDEECVARLTDILKETREQGRLLG